MRSGAFGLMSGVDRVFLIWMCRTEVATPDVMHSAPKPAA
jgi:hypothetical protein